MTDPIELLPIKDAAARLRLPEWRVRELSKSPEYHECFVRFGRRVYFRWEKQVRLVELAQEHRVVA